jgi:hypothetical protein
MKFLILILLSCFYHSKPLTCKDFKEGTFELPSIDNSVHKIIRTANKQIEIVEKEGQHSEFDIKWLDECTYILYNRRVTKGTDEMPQFNKDTLYNKISNIDGKTCTVTSWFSWAEKLDSKMTKVK